MLVLTLVEYDSLLVTCCRLLGQQAQNGLRLGAKSVVGHDQIETHENENIVEKKRVFIFNSLANHRLMLAYCHLNFLWQTDLVQYDKHKL